MSLLSRLELDVVTPARLWSALEPEVRRQAGRIAYDRERDRALRDQVDAAVAEAIRFRPSMVRKLPADKRVDYLVRAVHPDDSLAQDLLVALHLADRSALLSAFLDHLEIPHDNGLIDPDHEVETPDPAALRGAVEQIAADFSSDEVDLYIACLISMDPEVWGGLLEIARERTRA